ncbi:hypothetical protein F5Y10DRAFT_292289 [Nemania abortiva]|nr:hypothetical protein F5Y10DRAFT_292289 [Nemania abortiva]
MAVIQSHLVTHQRKISPAYVALVGTPGVGKTSLAKQFFHLEKQNCYYKYLFLIPADNRAKIYRAFTEIYQSLGLGATGAANTELVNELVLEHLAQIRKRWLIIYDNADESGLIQDYLPLEGDGSIIIVSRNKNIAEGLPKGTKTIHIKGLCDTEAQNLLLSRLNGGVHSERERELSRRIAQRFQCWPLALRQLSAFLEESETSMETMWSLLCQQTNIEGDIYSYKDSTSSYEFTLQASWSQILSTLQVPTIKLLNMLSLVDPDNIPSEIFSQGDSTGPPFPFTQFEYLSARAPLLKYDIVTKMEDGILSVHRLVQNTRLRMLHDDDRNEAFNAMLLILSHHFPKQALGDHMHALWGKCEVFLGSVLAFDTAVNQWQPRLDDPSSFLNLICDCTWYLWEIGQYEEALPRLASSEAFCASTIGLGSLEAARIYVNQGSVYSSLNRYGEAGPLFQKALDIRRVLLPQDHQLVVNSYMQVGNYLTWQGQCDDAVAAHEHVVRMRETYTTLSPGIAIISYLNLSRALLMAKRLAEATKAVDKAESWEEKLPNDTEKTYYGAHRLYIIGNIHLAGRKVVEALEAHQMAYQKRLESQATAYLIATSKHKIGIILAELGRIEEAIEFISDEITLLGSLPGNSKCKLTRLSRSEMKLANILLRSGLESASLDHRERAFKYYEEAFGVIIGDQLDLDFDTLVPPIDR